ncbi:MAG: hypothetical protein RLZ35_642 [Pseudomonadota bacterium]|jgi:spore cortex formation protein SpoVR/YcgB (stage V sporulation)
MKQSVDWTIEGLSEIDQAIARLAKEKYHLDTYPNQIEIINAEQMITVYSSSGLPLNYPHWSFGKQFLQVEKLYQRGQMGLAYELVINSNPCITYLMEENTPVMQTLVIAHACYGHNAFFKGNYLFKAWTDADAIVDYMLFAKRYIHCCEEKYGQERVESLIDACHAIINQGVDKYRRPPKLSLHEESERQAEREAYIQSQINTLWRTLPQKNKPSREPDQFPLEPEENFLYFFEKNAPLLESWEREIVRIIRKISQYFYPQRQTKVMNEGWATFWHYTLIHDLYRSGIVDDAFMLEFYHHHTNVIYQLPYNSPYFYGINPYTLGFSIFKDIRRICESPTKEDRQWFPDFAGKDWLETIHFAMKNFKDESFIAQFLSPALIRELKLFNIIDDQSKPYFEVNAIHNDEGYRKIREALSQQYDLSIQEPNIQIYRVNRRGDRSLTIRYTPHAKRPLDTDTLDQVIKHIHALWGFQVKIEEVQEDGSVQVIKQCP